MNNLQLHPTILRLKAFRESRGFSQTELAEIIGVDHNSIYRWESGLRSPRDLKILELAIDTLEIRYKKPENFSKND